MNMCSTENVDDRVLFALSTFNQAPTTTTEAPPPPLARLLLLKSTVEYLMRKTRVTVGRWSAKSAADVDAGSSTYISRNHLEIYRADSRFYALVTGKNGVFVDEIFHRKGSAPFELQRLAVLRFPSTDITIQFHILVEDEPKAPIKSPVPYVDDSPVKENGKMEVLCKADSPVGKHPLCESQPLLPSTELKTEIVCPVTVKSEEIVTKPRSRESHARESKSSVFEDGGRDGSKPAYSYAQLIVQAISSQKDRQLTLSGIYTYITKKYPYYRSGDKGWQNSIRHNLSLNRYFIKVPRAQEESGKGSFWRIDPSSEAMLIEQAFKKRRQRSSQGSGKTGQGDTTPSLVSMSSAETDGMVTPEDSCLSWEGAAAGTDETSELIIADNSKPPSAALYQENGTTYETRANQLFEDSQPQASAPSFAHHTLPQLITRPQIFIAKPSGVSGTLGHPPGVVPLQLPSTMINSASTVAVKSNDLDIKDSDKVFMLPDKPPSFMGYMPRPAQIQGFHPKTLIVRMNSSNSVSGTNPVGGSLVRLAFGMPAVEAQNLMPAVASKVEMESEEMSIPIDSPSCVGYNSASELMNGEMKCFKLRTISN